MRERFEDLSALQAMGGPPSQEAAGRNCGLTCKALRAALVAFHARRGLASRAWRVRRKEHYRYGESGDRSAPG